MPSFISACYTSQRKVKQSKVNQIQRNDGYLLQTRSKQHMRNPCLLSSHCILIRSSRSSCSLSRRCLLVKRGGTVGGGIGRGTCSGLNWLAEDEAEVAGGGRGGGSCGMTDSSSDVGWCRKGRTPAPGGLLYLVSCPCCTLWRRRSMFLLHGGSVVDFSVVGGFAAARFLVGVFGIRRSVAAFAADTLLDGLAVVVTVPL